MSVQLRDRACSGLSGGLGLLVRIGSGLCTTNILALPKPPFSLTPDPRFSYTNALYQEAFATLRYGIEARKGFIVITGEAGTGKTTLLRRLMQSFGRHVQTAYIYNPHVSFDRAAASHPKRSRFSQLHGRPLEMVAQLNEYLIKQLKEHNIVTLLVDEAQELSIEMLEEIRLAFQLETDTQKLLQIVLMGQPELERKLDQPELRQLKQRVALRCRLDPLPANEVGEYIATRLKAVGYRAKICSMLRLSRKLPRILGVFLVSSISSVIMLLLIAFAASKKNCIELLRSRRSLAICDLTSKLRCPKLRPLRGWARPKGTIEKLEGFRSTRARRSFGRARAGLARFRVLR